MVESDDNNTASVKLNKEQKKLLNEIQQYFDPNENICDLIIMYEMTGYKVDTETS